MKNAIFLRIGGCPGKKSTYQGITSRIAWSKQQTMILNVNMCECN